MLRVSISILLLSAAAATAQNIIALKLDDSVSGLTTTTAALDAGTAPAIGTADNQWGFSSTNNQALVSVSPEADNLASYVFGSRVDSGEDAPAFDAVIGGLDSGTDYNIYAYYVASTLNADDWGIQAGLNGGGLAYYNDEDGVRLATGPFSIHLHRVLLGKVSGTTSATVNFDDSAGLGITTNPRSFVKGIGVEVIDPSLVPGNAGGRYVHGTGHAVAATWQGPAVTADIGGGGLGYSDGVYQILAAPGRAALDFSAATINLPLSAALDVRSDGAFEGLVSGGKIGADGSTMYFSLLLEVAADAGAGDIAIFTLLNAANNSNWNSTECLRVGKLNATATFGAKVPATGASFDTGVAPDGAAHLIVGRIDFASGDDALTLWFDPALAAGESGGSQVAPFATASADFSFLGWQFRGNTAFSGDEIRFGDTWESVVPVLDSDLDGLADAWELLWVGDLSLTSGVDSDGDGVSNDDEAAAGTNPLDPASHPFAAFSAPAALLSWVSEAGTYYRAQESDDLDEWTDLTGDLTGDGGEFVVEVPSTGPRRFFRLRISTQPTTP